MNEQLSQIGLNLEHEIKLSANETMKRFRLQNIKIEDIDFSPENQVFCPRKNFDKTKELILKSYGGEKIRITYLGISRYNATEFFKVKSIKSDGTERSTMNPIRSIFELEKLGQIRKMGLESFYSFFKKDEIVNKITISLSDKLANKLKEIADKKHVSIESLAEFFIFERLELE